MQDENVVTDAGYSAGRCGYCGSSSGFLTHGMLTEALRVGSYQDLLDVGWRRCGSYLYRPDVMASCCPAYTIRLDATQFEPSKGQRKVLKKFRNYLNGGALASRFSQSAAPVDRQSHQREERSVDRLFRHLLENVIRKWSAREGLPDVEVKVIVAAPSTAQKKHLPESVLFTSPSCIALFFALKKKLGGAMRWSSAEAMAESVCASFGEAKDTLCRIPEAASEEYLLQWSAALQHLSLRQVKGHINFHFASNAALLSETHSQELLNAISCDSMTRLESVSEPVSEDEASDVTLPVTSLPPEFCHAVDRPRRFAISFSRSAFLEEEYVLYRKYQMAVHNDPPLKCGRLQYSRFLVESPLIGEAPNEAIPEPGYGAFHMQYRIDGRLVAVGVVDLLPRCLSSKYFFWDPDFASLSLGKLSALKEIEWIQSAQTHASALRYYYMGYYIHSCPKMRYKGDYAPSELLCPQSLQWIALTDDVRAQLSDIPGCPLASIPGISTKPNLAADIRGSVETQSVAVDHERLSFVDYKIQSMHQTQPFSLFSSQINSTPEIQFQRLGEHIAAWQNQTFKAAHDLHYCIQ